MIGFFKNIKFSATYQIIFITCLVSIFAFLFNSIFGYLQLVPSKVIEGGALWLLLTHIFLHGNFIHLFANMFSLFFIGSTTEKILGRKRFISIYFVSGVFAGLLSVTLAGFFGFGYLESLFGSPNMPMVGASGAIFGLAGVLAALIPRSKVYILAGPLFAIILSSFIDYMFKNSLVLSILHILITGYIFLSIFSMFSFNPEKSKFALPLSIPLWMLPFIAIFPLMIFSLFVPSNIGNIAHLGGFFAGLVYGLILRNKYPQKTMLLQRMFK